MKKLQLFSKANFGKLTKQGGNLVLRAVDYDFEIEIQPLISKPDGKPGFGEGLVVPVKKDELYTGLAKSMFEIFIELFNRARFKSKDLPLGRTVFADIKHTFRNLTAFRLVGEYNVTEQFRNRRTVLEVYKLQSWDEKKMFDKDATQFTGSMVGSYVFDTISISKGSYACEDATALSELVETIKTAYFRTSYSYAKFLEDVIAESKNPKEAPVTLGEASTTSGYSSSVSFKPKTIPATDSEDYEETNLDDFEF